MKRIILLLFVFNVFMGYSQEEWTILDLSALKNHAEEIYSYSDKDSGHFATFVRSNRQIMGFYYNDKQELLDTLTVDATYRELDIFIGGAHEKENYTLFFSNSSESKYSALKIDFKAHSFSILENLGISNKNERVVAYTENQSQFHILTVIKNSSLINAKTLSPDGTYNTTVFDLSNESFETDTGLPVTVDALLFAKKSENAFQTIDTDVPNSLEQTSAITKIYQEQNQLRLTNNTYNKHTYLLDFNFDTNGYTYGRIENPNFDKNNKRSNYNSFVLDTWFFDTYATADGIVLNIYDNDSKSLKKTYHVIPGDSITFKNSPIIHEDGTSRSVRDFEKTARFVRHVNSSNIGVAVYPLDDKYILTLGASQAKPNAHMMIVGGVIGGVIGAALFSAFDSYGTTESTRIVSVFDHNFDHVKGAVPTHAFDKIKDFIKEENLQNKAVQTIFKNGNSYIWGYYNKAGKFYRFHQFN